MIQLLHMDMIRIPCKRRELTLKPASVQATYMQAVLDNLGAAYLTHGYD
jgi:hypothetical protein